MFPPAMFTFIGKCSVDASISTHSMNDSSDNAWLSPSFEEDTRFSWSSHLFRSLHHNPKHVSPDAFPPPPSFPEIKKLLGRKWRVWCGHLCNLCSFALDSHEVLSSSSLSLAQDSVFWKRCFGLSRSQSVCEIVGAARRIGLLYLKSEWSYSLHLCSSYWIDLDFAHALLEWCSTAGIVPVGRLKGVLSLQEQLGIIDNPSVRHSYIQKVKKPCRVVPFKGDRRLPPLTDEEVVYGLYESLPQYRKLLLTLQEINTFLPQDEHHRCSPTIARDKHGYITKIGLRATNPWVSSKNEDDGNPRFHGVLRDDLLADKLGSWTEYDIKACVPSVSMLMTTGRWRNDDEDLYELMSGIHFKSKEERKLFKGLFLPVYFNSSPKQIMSHFKYTADEVSYVINRDEWNYSYNEVSLALHNIRCTVGQLGTVVFLHESCICANAMLRMLKEEGWRVLQIYDGFYIQTDGSHTDAYEKETRASAIVREEAERYYQVFHRLAL